MVLGGAGPRETMFEKGGRLCLLESVSLLSVGVLIVIDFACEHVERSRPEAALAIERAVNDQGLLCFRMLCYANDLVFVSFEVAIYAWCDFAFHARSPSF